MLAVLTVPGTAQVPGSLAADRARLAELTGDTVTSGPSQLLRGMPPLRRVLPFTQVPLHLVEPEFRVSWNSAIPYSLNDGSLWAGRGWSASVTAGVGASWTRRSILVRVAVAPTLSYSQNLPFQTATYLTGPRADYRNPFHGSEAPLDLPLRFGDRHLVTLHPGRSIVAVRGARVEAGITSESEWWGPGIRNAIVMSNNAPGIPRFFVKTAAPLATAVGGVDARLIAGTLTRSLFASPTTSEHRTLSGVLLQVRPWFDTTLTLGFSRVVYRSVEPGTSPFLPTVTRSFDALLRWEYLRGVGMQETDQIGAVFARWAIPGSGFEVYGEWARMDLPRSAAELLTAPHHAGGWTFGFQWVHAARPPHRLRLQSEITYLEQSRVFPDRPAPDFYAGMASPHGYTQRGQIIGAAIGPGGSSQWLAADWMASQWQVGAFVGRIRWENDAMYRMAGATFWNHDVSLLAGVRTGWRTPRTDLGLELTAARRYNYLFQNGIARPGGIGTVDMTNLSMSLVATPR